jgi:hypothetical protein
MGVGARVKRLGRGSYTGCLVLQAFDPRALRSHPFMPVGLIAVVLVLSLALRPSSLVFDLPLTEDGYYTLTIARHVSLGRVFSIDGIHSTTGFQPLWAVLTAPLFAIAPSNEGAIRGVLLLSGLCAIASAIAWSRLSQLYWQQDRYPHRAIFIALYLSQFQLIAQSFNGLETALNLLLIGVTGLAYVSGSSKSWSLTRSIQMGVLLGLCALCRIDNVVFAALLCLAIAVREGSNWRSRSQIFLAVSVTSFLVFLPWPLYCLATTGYPLPVSGLALALNAGGASARIANAAGGLARDVLPNIVGEVWRPLGLIAGLAAVVASLLLGSRRALRGAAISSLGRESIFAIALMGFGLFLLSFYTITNEATYFYPRYWILSSVVVISVWARLLAHFERAARATVAVVFLCLVVPGWLSISGWHGAEIGKRINALQSYKNDPLWEQVRLAGLYQRPSEKIGAPQTGTLGFFRENVVNLDGKVNLAAYEARRRGKLLEYVLSEKIALLIDFNVYLNPVRFPYFSLDPPIDRYFTRVHPDAPQDYTTIVLRRRADH